MQRLVAQCSATAMVQVMQRDCQTDAVASCDGLPLCWVEISHLFESYFQSCDEMGREPNHAEGCYDQSGAPMPSFLPRYCCFPSLTCLPGGLCCAATSAWPGTIHFSTVARIHVTML